MFMKLKCISCDAIARAIYHCSAVSPHLVDIELVKLGLHVRPDDLREHLQDRINRVAEQPYDAILLGYGLCGQATRGLTAAKIPLVIPKAHDCITLYLGSRDRYLMQHGKCPGTIWYTKDYIERSRNAKDTIYLGMEIETVPSTLYERYVRKYGKKKADYLMQIMHDWQKHYQRLVFIDQGMMDTAAEEIRAKADAKTRGWRFEKLTGDLDLIRRLVFAKWDDDFLVVKPGNQIAMAFGGEVMRSEAIPGV
jgi:hypothetical protein